MNEDPIMLALGLSPDDLYSLLLALLFATLATFIWTSFFPSKET